MSPATRKGGEQQLAAERLVISGVEWFGGDRHQFDGRLQSLRVDLTLEVLEIQQGTEKDRVVIQQLRTDGEPYDGLDPILVREDQGIVYVQRLRMDGEGHILRPEEPCLVRVLLPEAYDGGLNISSRTGDVHVTEVRAHSLDVHMRSGVLEMRECRLTGDMHVQGASGSAVIDSTECPDIGVEMHSGSVHTHDLHCAKFRAKTFSGSQKHEVYAKKTVFLDGYSGSIMLEGAASELITKTVSGAQKITVRDLHRAEMTSKSGSIYLTVPESATLREVKASTLSGGIHLLLPPDVRPIPQFESRTGAQRFISADFTKTSQEVHIHASTLSGSLSIKPCS